MKLKETGKIGGSFILLWPEAGTAVETAAPVRALEQNYRVLVPEFTPEETASQRIAATERELLRSYDGRIRGAYGLRSGGTELLAMLAQGSIRVRTVIVEGAVDVPTGGLKAFTGTLFHWKGSRDKAAKKSCEDLRRAFPALRTLTMKKLKAEQNFCLIRPDIMLKRLETAFGSAGTVRVSTLVPQSTQLVWRHLNRRPAGSKALSALQTMEPVRRTDEDHTQIIEGTASGVPLWSHMTRVEPCGDFGTVCVDQVEISAGALTPAAAKAAEIYLKALQKHRNRQMRKE